MLNKLHIKSEFLKSVVLLTSGTFMAQVVSYVATPVITRLFTPDEIGELGIFLRITAFITAIATARYELSLPLPKKDQHAFQLFRLSLRIATITLLLTFLIGLIYWGIQGFSATNFWIVLMIVVGSFFMIFKNIGTNWAIRMNNYKAISASSILTSFTANGLKIVAGLLAFGSLGLIVATVIGGGAAIIFFVKDYINAKYLDGFQRSKKKIKVLSNKYRDFPIYNLPHMLLDHGRELLVAFFVVMYFDQTVFGSYDHSFRMLKLPLALIGTAMGQVFFNRCSRLYAEHKALFPMLKRTTLQLFLISIIPFSIVFFFGEDLFLWVFGAEWGLSGRISQLLAPWLMINFVASPISTIPMVVEKQKAFLWVGGIGSILQVSAFGILPLLYEKGWITFDEIFVWISVIMVVFSLAMIGFKLWITKKADERNVIV